MASQAAHTQSCTATQGWRPNAVCGSSGVLKRCQKFAWNFLVLKSWQSISNRKGIEALSQQETGPEPSGLRSPGVSLDLDPWNQGGEGRTKPKASLDR
jgi:hypothetical protein